VLLPTLSLEPAPTASPSDPLPADHQALLLDGRAVAATLRAEVQAQVADLQARHPVLPGLAVLVVGQDPASRSYLTMILKTCRTVGLPAELFELPATATRQMIQA
jgi:methylenetetrahydrofolate dehydrogenase (NADP+)/methenyltetrahydrofolate cyclohydrolase